MLSKCDICQSTAEYVLKHISTKEINYLCEKDLIELAEELMPRLWITQNGTVLCNKHKKIKGFPEQDLVPTEQGRCYYCLLEGKEKELVITIYSTPENTKLWEALENKAKAEGKTISELVEEILTKYIKFVELENFPFSFTGPWDKKLNLFTLEKLALLGLNLAQKNSELLTEIRRRQVNVDADTIWGADHFIKFYRHLLEEKEGFLS